MSKANTKLIATVFLDLRQDVSYEKLTVVLEKLKEEGLVSDKVVLLSDSNSNRYSDLFDLELGLVYEISFDAFKFAKKQNSESHCENLLVKIRNLVFFWKKDLCFRGIDFYFQSLDSYNASKKLFIFDMDSTLIQQEVINEMAKKIGVGDQVSEITEAAMRGEIDFETSLRKRVALLSGAPVSIFDEVRSKITFSKGAKDLCSFLKTKGCLLAVVSGGFLPLANHVKKELSLDYAFANELRLDSMGHTLTGETSGEVVTAEKKAFILQELASKHQIPLQGVVAVGDGANDLMMMDVAGLSVAFNAKPKVQEKAIGCINRPSLMNLIFFLGIKSSELV